MTVSSTARKSEKPGLTPFGRAAGSAFDYMYAIDPGISGTGIAAWEHYHMPDAVAPSRVETWTPPRLLDWKDSVTWLGDKFIDFVNSDQAVVFCEMMEYQESAKRATAWKKGDMQKTVYLIGYLAGLTYMKPGVSFVPVLVREWKGQLPKDVIIRRVTNRLTPRVCRSLGMTAKSHDWDAVGLGLWARGVLREGRR